MPPSKVPSRARDHDLARGARREAAGLDQHVDRGACGRAAACGRACSPRPRTITNWLWYSRTFTSTCGLTRKSSASSARDLALDLGDGEPGHRHLAQQRVGDAAVRLHRRDARQVGVVEDGDLEDVAGADLVVAAAEARGGGGRTGWGRRGVAAAGRGAAVGGAGACSAQRASSSRRAITVRRLRRDRGRAWTMKPSS